MVGVGGSHLHPPHPISGSPFKVVQLLLSSNMCAALLEPRPGDATDPNGTSPLHLAAKNGHIDIIRYSRGAGRDIRPRVLLLARQRNRSSWGAAGMRRCPSPPQKGRTGWAGERTSIASQAVPLAGWPCGGL